MTPPSSTAGTAGTKKKADREQLAVGTVEAILKRAPSDLVEETIEVPEWECSVRLRSFSAAQNARIKAASIDLTGEGAGFDWGELEVAQFLEGVIEPKFTEDQVRELAESSALGFARVIAWIDEHTANDKEAMRLAREEFRAPKD